MDFSRCYWSACDWLTCCLPFHFYWVSKPPGRGAAERCSNPGGGSEMFVDRTHSPSSVFKFSKPGGGLQTLSLLFVRFRLSLGFSLTGLWRLFFSGIALLLSDGAASSDTFPTSSPQEVLSVSATLPPSVVPWVLAVEDLPLLTFPFPRLTDLDFSPRKFCEPIFLLLLLTSVTALSRLSTGGFISVSSRVWELSDLSSLQRAKSPSRFSDGFTDSFLFSLCPAVLGLLLVDWRFFLVSFSVVIVRFTFAQSISSFLVGALTSPSGSWVLQELFFIFWSVFTDNVI